MITSSQSVPQSISHHIAEISIISIACQTLEHVQARFFEVAAGTLVARGVGMLTPPADTGDERTFAVIGAAMTVHKIMGSGFLEKFYKDALAIEFVECKIPFDREVPCAVEYKGHRLSGNHYIDFVCLGGIVIEVKARSSTGPAEHAQVLNYLASSGHALALLLNFGTPRLEHKRFIWTKPRTGI